MFFNKKVPVEDEKILNPRALVNIKLAEISMEREVKKVFLTSTQKQSTKTKVLSNESEYQNLYNNLTVGDIVKTKKSGQTGIFTIIDIDGKTILGEKQVYNAQKELESTGQRLTIEPGAIYEIMIGDSFDYIESARAKKYFASRNALGS